MASRHVFTRLCEAMAEGQWIEVSHQTQPLFLVGPSAAAYWASAGADGALVSHGDSPGLGLLGRYLITRQLGALPELDLRNDAAIIRALEAAGLRRQDAGDFLQSVDRLSGNVDYFDALLRKLMEVQAKLTKSPGAGFLLELIAGRKSAKELPSDTVEVTELDGYVQKNHRDAVSAKYIRELGTMFEKLRRRLEGLEVMVVQDAALNEATRAYLYGFSRSAILLSAAALERALLARPELTQSPGDNDGLHKLLQRAFASRVLDHEHFEAGIWLKALRNRVAHDGYEPGPLEGAEGLDIGRRLVSRLEMGSS